MILILLKPIYEYGRQYYDLHTYKAHLRKAGALFLCRNLFIRILTPDFLTITKLSVCWTCIVFFSEHAWTFFLKNYKFQVTVAMQVNWLFSSAIFVKLLVEMYHSTILVKYIYKLLYICLKLNSFSNCCDYR